MPTVLRRYLRAHLRVGFAVSVTGAMAFGVGHAFAQDPEVGTNLQCLRYLQSYERSYHIPEGLLTAVSLTEAGRRMDGAPQLVAWPWTINVAGQGRFFDRHGLGLGAQLRPDGIDADKLFAGDGHGGF